MQATCLHFCLELDVVQIEVDVDHDLRVDPSLKSDNMSIRTRLFFVLCATSLVPSVMQAQVLTDFEDGLIDQWLVEADGVPSLTNLGNPGNCLRVTDQVLSVVNQMVLPWAYTGNWSAAQATDSLSFDLYANGNSGNLLNQQGLPLITLSGPGGTAVAMIDTVPLFYTWQHLSIALDSASWTVTGSWTDLLAEIQVVKIRTEFIQGSEWVQLDNVKLSFTPLIEPLIGTLCSTWDSAGFYDGWSFQNVGSIQVSMVQGNPPGSVRMGDASNVLTNAVAAPKFRGDWSDLDMQGLMRFDLFLQTSSTNYIVKDYLVRLSGPGGVTRYTTTDSITTLTTNQWYTHEIPIAETNWEVLSGTWSDLLAFVAEIRLDLEFIQGTGEVIFLDNFCLDTDMTTVTPHLSEGGRLVSYPNPSSGQFTLVPTGSAGPFDLTIVDASGRTVLTRTIRNTTGAISMDLSTHGKGLYSVQLRNPDGSRMVTRMMVE